MTNAEFLSQLQQMLQCEQPLAIDTDLIELEEWDSLGFMLVIAFFDKHFSIRLSFEQLKDCNTIAEVIALAQGKIA